MGLGAGFIDDIARVGVRLARSGAQAIGKKRATAIAGAVAVDAVVTPRVTGGEPLSVSLAERISRTAGGITGASAAAFNAGAVKAGADTIAREFVPGSAGAADAINRNPLFVLGGIALVVLLLRR